jgi:hypothetical protein
VAPNRNPVVGGPCPERGITSRTPIDGVETPVICTGPIGGAAVWTPY